MATLSNLTYSIDMKKTCIKKCSKLRAFSGKFLNFGKSDDVKDLTNIMCELNNQ